MVSDRIESYLKKIIVQTKKKRIKWRPIEELLLSDKCNNEVWFTYQNEFTEVVYPDSFYAKKNGEFIYFITSKWISGKDESESLHKEIMISCSEQSEIVNLPFYESLTFDNLLDAIKEYWNDKCNNYSQDISDIFDVLGSFAEE